MFNAFTYELNFLSDVAKRSRAEAPLSPPVCILHHIYFTPRLRTRSISMRVRVKSILASPSSEIQFFSSFKLGKIIKFFEFRLTKISMYIFRRVFVYSVHLYVSVFPSS